jgi:hypothetical protein
MNPTDKPRVLLKSKNIQQLMEYCIENKLEFTVIPGNVQDEWEVEINVKNLIKAVELGMFMRSNRFELAGNALFPKPVAVKAPRKVKESQQTPADEDTTEETEAEETKVKKPAPKADTPSLGLDFSS